MAAVVLATLPKLQFEAFGRDTPTALYLAAVMFTAWFGGAGPGLFATGLATASGAYLFSAPYGSFHVDSSEDLIRLALGAAEGAVVSLLAGALRRAKVRAEAGAAQLQGRTAELVRANVELEREVLARGHAERALRQTAEQLVHAQRMESVGRIAGGVAHDFNNMLAIMLGYADVLLRRLERGDPARTDVEQLRAAGGRAANLAAQLLSFSRRQEPHAEVVDLGELVAGIEEMIVPLLGPSIELRVRRDVALWPVAAIRAELEQVIVNLVTNARDAMPDGGALTIETTNIEIDAELARACGAAEGPHVALSVRDTGVGMDETTMARVFEPFFTTKERGKGTGLGLALAAAVVQQAHGTICIESRPGAGTELRIYLPRASRSVGAV